MANETSHTDAYVPDDALIARQNDRWRRAVCTTPPGMTGPDGLTGRVLFTRAVAARGPLFPLLCLAKIAGHETFDPEDDPDGRHDFGAVNVDGVRVWFKIDLYADERMEWGTERPDDPSRTYRVMTVMLPSDW